MLFNRGNAISGAPIIKGTNQLPNPPIITGITRKKIITNACAVRVISIAGDAGTTVHALVNKFWAHVARAIGPSV